MRPAVVFHESAAMSRLAAAPPPVLLAAGSRPAIVALNSSLVDINSQHNVAGQSLQVEQVCTYACSGSLSSQYHCSRRPTVVAVAAALFPAVAMLYWHETSCQGMYEPGPATQACHDDDELL